MAETNNTIDWQCIGIEKVGDDGTTVLYRFSSSVSAPDAQNTGHREKIGDVVGLAQIDKQTGEITLVDAMPGDDDNRRFASVRHVLTKHFRNRQFPDKTMFAAG